MLPPIVLIILEILLFLPLFDFFLYWVTGDAFSFESGIFLSGITIYIFVCDFSFYLILLIIFFIIFSRIFYCLGEDLVLSYN